MICKVDTNYDGDRMTAAVNYHEDKVAAGVAERDELQLAAFDRESIKQAFNTHIQIFNSTVRKNKFHQVTISFDPTDNLTAQKKREVVDKWMGHMGYSNHPYVLYHHMDKEHDHWHLITTCSNLDGMRADTRNNFHKSAIYSRVLEKEYGIRQLSTQAEKEEANLKELALKKYAFKNAIEAMSPSAKLRFGIASVLKELGNQNDYTGVQFRGRYIKGLKQESFEDLLHYLREEGLLKRSKKDELFLILEKTRLASKSEAEYMVRLKESDVYVRKIFKNGISYQYGYKGFYVADSRLSPDLTASRLRAHFSGRHTDEPMLGKEKTNNVAIRQLSKTLHRAIQYSTDFSGFEAYLRGRNIAVSLASNSGGVYGYKVVFNGAEYKGSSLSKSLSYTNIMKKLKANESKDIPVFVKKTQKPSVSSPIVSQGKPLNTTPSKPASSPSLAKGFGKIGRALQNLKGEEEPTEEEIKRLKRDKGMSRW